MKSISVKEFVSKLESQCDPDQMITGFGRRQNGESAYITVLDEEGETAALIPLLGDYD